MVLIMNALDVAQYTKPWGDWNEKNNLPKMRSKNNEKRITGSLLMQKMWNRNGTKWEVCISRPMRGEKMENEEEYWFFIECDDDKMGEFKDK